MQQLALILVFYTMAGAIVVYMLVGAYKDFSSLKDSEILPENIQQYLKNNIKIQLAGAVCIITLIAYAVVQPNG
jgi:hypothetical protein